MKQAGILPALQRSPAIGFSLCHSTVAPCYPCTMTGDDTVLPRCRYRQGACDDAAHLFHLPAQPEDERQKRQAACEQRGISCLFPRVHGGMQVFLRLIEVTGPQEADAKSKVRKSRLVLVSSLQRCS